MSRRFILGLIIAIIVTLAPAGCAARSAPPAVTERVSAMEGYRSVYNPAHIDSAEAFGLAVSDGGAVILDVRSEESYLENHVTSAVNVPFENLAGYAEANIPQKDRLIICYCFCGDKGGSALSAYDLLTSLGYTRVFYTEPGDEWAYEGAAAAVAVRAVTGAEAEAIYDTDPAAVLLDVRNRDEYDAGHIEGSVLIPVSELEDRLHELPDKDAPIIVYCAAGKRSAAACGILIANGYTDLYDMRSADNWPGPLITE